MSQTSRTPQRQIGRHQIGEPQLGEDPAGSGGRRPHTGRRRNDEARRAILDAALHLLSTANGRAVTVETIAQEAGVGKQTIYRWWPSKGAVLIEALTGLGADLVPPPDAGSLVADLDAFLTATFEALKVESTASTLRTLAAEASRDGAVAEVMREFTGARRAELREIVSRGHARGELAEDADLDLLVDQAYALLWYRFLLGHAPLDAAVAERLARGLAAQARP